MQNNLIDKKIVDQKLAACGISDMEDATIRDIVKVVNMVEAESGEKFIRMEMGVPGLAPSKIGIDAEIEALRAGCAQFYPMLEGHKEFKEEGSKFVKNFVDIDIKPEGIIPTVGSMQACFAAFMAVTECKKGKDTVLFIDPGFPVQKHKCKSSENRSSHLTFIITGAKNYGRNWKSIFPRETSLPSCTATRITRLGYVSRTRN